MMQGKLRWVMFAAALGMVACKGDPTDSLRNGVDHVTASPTSLQINQGDSVGVILEALDEQGNRLNANFSASTTDPLLSVTRDIGFIPVYDENNHLVPPPEQTRARFFVKALGLTAATMSVTGGGSSRDLSVLTVPTRIGAIYTPAPPLNNIGFFDTISVAPPTGLSFDPAVPPLVAGAPGPPIVTDFTATNLSFILAGGTSGVLTAQMVFDFAGGTSGATLVDSVVMNKPAGAGTDALATAPTIPIPATGNSEVVYDKLGFNNTADCLNSEGVPCRLYKVVLAAPRTFDITATWFDDPLGVGATTDLGVYWVDAGGNDIGSFGCDAHGNDGVPETCSVSLGAGTFYLAVVTFAAFYAPPDDANPPSVAVAITGT